MENNFWKIAFNASSLQTLYVRLGESLPKFPKADSWDLSPESLIQQIGLGPGNLYFWSKLPQIQIWIQMLFGPQTTFDNQSVCSSFQSLKKQTLRNKWVLDVKNGFMYFIFMYFIFNSVKLPLGTILSHSAMWGPSPTNNENHNLGVNRSY